MSISPVAKRGILLLTIDLGGKKDDILVHSDDTPMNLAKAFCSKHNLSSDTEYSLCQYISSNLSKISSRPLLDSKPTSPVPDTLPEAPPRLKHNNSNNSNSLITSTSLSKSPSKRKSVAESKQSLESRLGERLYYQAIKDLKLKEEKNLKILADRQAQEINGLTFRPVINLNKVTRVESSLEMDLIMRDKKIREKIENRRAEKAEEELKDCTFRPHVNKTSSKLDRIKTKDRNLYLYEYSKEKKNESLSPKKTNQRKLSGDKAKGNSCEKVNISKTIERLLGNQKTYNLNIQKAKQVQSFLEKIDPETGKELFKPQIISTNRIKRDKSIWDELYTPKQKPILLESPSIKLINKNSEKITEKLRNKKYQQIFNDLKPIDGKIKYSTIDFKSLDEKLVEILSPLLKKLAESSCETDFSHFWEEMDSLLKVLTPDEKKYLILLKPKC